VFFCRQQELILEVRINKGSLCEGQFQAIGVLQEIPMAFFFCRVTLMQKAHTDTSSDQKQIWVDTESILNPKHTLEMHVLPCGLTKVLLCKTLSGFNPGPKGKSCLLHDLG
jgi:hypothetical protein